MHRWDEPFVFGAPEAKAVLLAHAIILAIAWVRYVARPWWRARAAATRRGPAEGGRSDA